MAFPMVQQAVYQVSVVAKYLDQDALNIAHYSASERPVWAAPAPTSTEFLTALETRWVNAWQAILNPEFRIVRFQIDRIEGWKVTAGGIAPVITQTDERVPPAPIAGTIVGDNVESFVAVTCRKKTARAGFRYRGSWRQCGMIEAQADTGPLANFLTPAAQGLFQAAWTNYFQFQINPNLGNMVIGGVFSLKDMSENVPSGPGQNPVPFWTVITSTPINRNFGSQVSRKVGHGT